MCIFDFKMVILITIRKKNKTFLCIIVIGSKHYVVDGRTDPNHKKKLLIIVEFLNIYLSFSLQIYCALLILMLPFLLNIYYTLELIQLYVETGQDVHKFKLCYLPIITQ